MIKYKKLLLTGLVSLVVISLAWQYKSITEELGSKVSAYYHEKIGGALFLHVDKSFYVPNESIWFKAYMLNNFLDSKVLYLRLLNKKKEIVLQKEFPVYDVRSHGDMLIPITTPPGKYTIVAYTDEMINFNPESVFTQEIRVIKDQASELKADAMVADTTAFSAGKTAEVNIKVSGVNGRGVKAKGTYRIVTNEKKAIADGRFYTDVTGIATINFVYPAVSVTDDLYLECKVSENNQLKELNFKLPKKSSNVLFNSYPEGGHLVSGVPNNVFLTTTDVSGQPLAVKVALRSQNRVITTATTNAQGSVIISFTPNVSETYSLSAVGPGYTGVTALSLKTETSGYVFHLAGSANHLALSIKNLNMPERVFLAGRTLTELKFNKSLTIKNGDSVRVDLPQDDSLNHILDLGLFDEGNKLLNERFVYLPAPEKYHVAVKFDKSDYAAREKVRATIAVTDAQGKPVAANLSVAVIGKATLDPSLEQQITKTDLYSLTHYDPHTQAITELNNQLIKESFRSGNWSDVLSYRAKGKINTLLNAAGVYGYLTSKKNKRIDLKTLVLFDGKDVTEVPIDESGVFSIPAKDLIVQRGIVKYLIINKDFNDIYDLHIKNYAADFDARIISTNSFDPAPFLDQAKYSPQLSAITSGKILNEVVITGKKNPTMTTGDFNVTEYHSPSCNDYVCFYNVLNCKKHTTGGSPPVEGQVYVLNGRPIRYHGCASQNEKSNIYKIKNIDSPQDFYFPDYQKEPVSTPELQSTICWVPNINTLADGKSNLEFYTSDVGGAFAIIIQGLTVHGLTPVFGKSEFKVGQKTGTVRK